MAVMVYQIRPPTVGLSYENWRDEATCNGMPVELFELQDFKEVSRGEQAETIAEGLKVCSGCPVRAACKNNSSEDDRYWTTRGGQPPEGLFPDSKMPGTAKSQVAGLRGGWRPRPLLEKCGKGHENWKVKPSGKRHCQTCENDAARKRWAKKYG